MRVLIIDKTAVLETSHERYEKLASIEGIELGVLSPKRWPEHMNDVRAERTSHPGYKIYLGETGWRGSYSRGFYLSGLTDAIRDFKPDIVQLLEEPWSLFAGQTVRKIEKLRPSAKLLFYTWENLFRRETYGSLLDPIHRKIERSVFGGASAGVCATRLASHVLLRKGFRKPTRVIPYGIHESFFLSEQEIEERSRRRVNDPPRVGYIGRLVRMKGVDTLIEAMRNVAFDLTLLGSGEAGPSLRRLADDLGVAGRIEWVSAVAPAEVPSYLEKLDLLVLPSRTTYTWAEQLGRVLLEAMAAGVPVVGSSSGSIPEVIGEDGWIFEEGNPADLAVKIGEAASNSSPREMRVMNAYRKVRDRYNWDRFARDLAELYREIESGTISS
jgi:glycosyltransferase involved in cell wall biosynthesis